MSDIINDHKTQGEWKIHLINAINLFSSKDSEETHSMYSKSDDMEVMMGNETDKIIEDLFIYLFIFLNGYQKKLEESMRGGEFVFDCFDLLYYKLHKISLNRGGSYIDSHKWLRNKKATINPKTNEDKCFQCAITVALIREQIKSLPERISNIKLIIDQYDWK